MHRTVQSFVCRSVAVALECIKFNIMHFYGVLLIIDIMIIEHNRRISYWFSDLKVTQRVPSFPDLGFVFRFLLSAELV